jgi:hypothetical protein
LGFFFPPDESGGISGNPGGRSSELAAQQSAAKLKAVGHAEEALNYLVKVLRSEQEATVYRLKAACDLLNRGLGLPSAQIDIEIMVRRKLTELTLAELQQLEERLVGSAPQLQ